MGLDNLAADVCCCHFLGVNYMPLKVARGTGVSLLLEGAVIPAVTTDVQPRDPLRRWMAGLGPSVARPASWKLFHQGARDGPWSKVLWQAALYARNASLKMPSSSHPTCLD